MITKIQAILSLVPNAQVVVRGEEVEWYEPKTAPVTDAQIDAEVIRLQAEEISKQEEQASIKASALAKLAALGLTQDEVKALVG
jgi:hypothetical protein